MDDRIETPPRGAPGALYSTSQIHHLMRVEFGRAQRYGYPLALLVAGVDGFERLRNRFGFDVAAEIHDRVAGLVRESTRGCDHLGILVDRRLVLVLPHTGRAGGEALAHRLLDAVTALAVEAEGERLSLTASVGLSAFADANTMFFDDLMEAAERAFDRAQSEGGSRAVFLGPGEAPA